MVMVLGQAKKLQVVIDLMNRLRYPQKFLLISLMFSLPMMVITYLLMSEIHTQIEFSQKEIYGNRYLRPVRKIWGEALRGQISVIVSSQKAQKETKLAPLNQALDQLKSKDRELGTILQTEAKFEELKQAITTLSTKDNRQNGFVYSLIIDRVNEIRSLVGDNSNLILDPQLNTYYLVEASLLKLPSIQQIITDIQLLNLAIAQQGKITPVQNGQLIQLSTLLKSQNRSLDNAINTTFLNNPKGELKTKLEKPLSDFDTKIKLILANLELNFRSAKYIPLDQELLNNTKESSFLFEEHLVEQLDLLIQKRIDTFNQRRFTILIFLGVMLLIVVALFTAFYLSVMKTVNELEWVAKQMSLGQFEGEFSLETKDELGMVVHSFNRVAKALRRAEEKYRSIFENSVEGIFQTTTDGQYLSANDALARIYGYLTADDLIGNLTSISGQLYVEKYRRDDFIELIEAYDKVTEFESQAYRQDGSIVWISESARAVRDVQGEIVYFEGIVQDISDRKEAERKLAHANMKITNLNKKLKLENLRMSTELEVTQRLQSMILPKSEELNNLIGIQIAGFMEPASEVGGDYYDVLQHNGRIKIAIGDVTGHGLESGLLMVMVQTAVRTLIESNETDIVRFMDVLNRTVYGNVQRMNSDKNLSLSLIDYSAGKLSLSGQHEEMILIRNGGIIERIDTVDLGFPIGLEADITSYIDRIHVDLNSGDVVVLYTDGITEAENTAGHHYGMERLCNVVSKNWQKSVEQIKLAVIDDLRSHIDNHKIYDDITLVVIKQD
jgi:phosphoserine phosphatase RsbU/P